MSRNAAALSDTISELYNAALDPDGWDDALRRCCAYLDGAALQVYALDPASRDCLFQLGHGLCPEYIVEYDAFFSRQSDRNDFHLARPDVDIGYDYLMTDERQLDHSECSRWRAKFGFRYYLGGPLMRSDDAVYLAALQRSRTQGHPQRADIEAYRGLRGHLAQALRIQGRLSGAQLRHRGAWEAIERASLGVVVLDRSGRLLECNRLARRVLASADGLIAEDRELRALRPIDDRGLKRMIGSARDGTGGGSLAIARRDSERPYSLIVAPIRDVAAFALPGEAHVLVLVNDPDGGREIATEPLRAHYGLTRKQVELTVLLTRGLTVGECAERLGIAEKTARRHLATIFARTGLHRQADLVRLALSLPGSRPPD